MTKEIIERLRSLDLSGSSHSRLSAIASCFLEPAFGWTRDACEELQAKLIEILEGNDGNDDNDNSDDCSCTHHRCDQHGRQVSYDVLENERHKAVCELRNMQMDTGNAIKKLAVALGLEWNPNNAPKSVALLQSRIIHLLGGDECNFSRVESYMDAMGEKSNPAETSDASTDHVSFDTRLKLKTYAYIILEFADTLGIGYPNGSKITDVAAEIRKRLNVLMSECKVMGFAKSAEIAKPESEDGGEVTITDEMREWIKSLYTPNSDELKLEGLRITDRIDVRAKRDRESDRLRIEKLERQRDHWHQQVTDMMNHADAMEHERDNLFNLLRDAAREYEDKHHWAQVWHDRAEDMRMERDELQASLRKIAERAGVPHDGDLSEYGDKKIANAVIGQLGETKQYVKSLEWVRDRRLPRIEAKRDELLAKLDDYDRTHVELPKDENDEYIHIGDVMDGYAKTIEVVELRYGRSGWVLISRDGNEYADTFAFTHHHEPTVEQVIRDLTLGKITESQAIERIEGINGQG